MTQISALHLTEIEGVELLKKSNIIISRRSYYTLKGKVSALTKRRLIDIAKELPEEHLKTLDLINLIEHKLIAKMNTEIVDDGKNEFSKDKEMLRIAKDVAMARIARIIVEIQPYKSAYQEGAKFALQELERRELEQKNNYLSILA